MPKAKPKADSEQNAEPLIERAEKLAKRYDAPAIGTASRRMAGGGGSFFRTAVFGGLLAFLFLLSREAWRAHIQGVTSPEPVADPAGGNPRSVGSQHAGLRFVADFRAGTSLSTLSLGKRSDGLCVPFMCSRSYVVRS